ncbi:MAG TPA: ribosome biogenesis GTPase Der, partial [Planctomycetota bacterium]|nr:ribosome biogenesis GTPase Der [Planctomycetota bacterium]
PWASAAIVGRPNVGKSTLFNAIVGMQVAITDAMAGTTRDRLVHRAMYNDRFFDLIDTGGMGVVDVPELAGLVEKQISMAIDEAAVLVFLCDAADGLTAADEDIARRLHRAGKPVVLAVNKVDSTGRETAAPEFSKLGFGRPLPISSLHHRGLDELLEALVARLPEEAESRGDGEFSIALVGRRNVGKSTFLNALAGQERVVVDSRPGTTRDSVDVVVERDGIRYTIVDTAGVRKRGRPENAPEYKSMLRSERALERADAAALVVDAMEGVGAIDKRLGRIVAESGKPCVIVVNKWDLAKGTDTPTGEYDEYLHEQMPGLSYAPVVFTVAKEAKRVWAAVKLLRELWELAGTDIRTPLLNKAVQRVIKLQPPASARSGAMPKIYYVVQTGRHPQRLTAFCARPEHIPDSYKKFFSKQLREELGLSEIPVKIRYKAR